MYMITGMLLNPVRQGQCWDMYFKYYMKSLVSENFSIRVYSSLFHEIDGDFVLLEWTKKNKMWLYFVLDGMISFKEQLCLVD